MVALDRFEEFVKANPKLASQVIGVLRGLVESREVDVLEADDLLGQVEVGTRLIADSQQTEHQIRSVAVLVASIVEESLLGSIRDGDQ